MAPLFDFLRGIKIHWERSSPLWINRHLNFFLALENAQEVTFVLSIPGHSLIRVNRLRPMPVGIFAELLDLHEFEVLNFLESHWEEVISKPRKESRISTNSEIEEYKSWGVTPSGSYWFLVMSKAERFGLQRARVYTSNGGQLEYNGGSRFYYEGGELPDEFTGVDDDRPRNGLDLFRIFSDVLRVPDQVLMSFYPI